MNISIRSITVDCHDPYNLARWWCEVFDVPPHPDDFPEDPEASCTPPSGTPRLLFERVPEAKTLKNRVHLDLRPERRRDDEVERLLGLGARFVADHRGEDRTGWVVLADPDGNEFCVERGGADA